MTVPAYFPPKPLLEQFKRHEDLRLVLYPCPRGKITGGWGHNFEARPVPGIPAVLGQRLSLDQAERLLVADAMLDGAAVLSRWPWAGGLDPARLAVLVNMSFNMGVDGLAGFRKTLALVQAGDYAEASREMLQSDWAEQVGDYAPDSPKGIKHNRPGRAWELSRQMRTGEWWVLA